MKILISAVACRPGAGSEGYVGWTSVNALARNHSLEIITHGGSRESIEAAMKEHPLRERMHFHYLRQPIHWNQNRMIARFQDWMDYRHWCVEARTLARDLVLRTDFDIAHHLTFATWRVASPLAGLGVPLVFGPVGGGEVFPKAFYSILSPSAKAFELARIASNHIAIRSPALRKMIQSTQALLPNNRETADVLIRAGADESRIRIATQSFMTPERIEGFAGWREHRKPFEGGEMRIFAGGNLEGRKGVAIALRALANAAKSGLRFQFLYGGHGPERGHLLRLTRQLGLEDRVRFENMLEKDAYMEALHSAHVYLLPSLREGCPITLLEAMLAGCVPVVARCGGQAVAVTEDCGILVEPTDTGTLENGIAKALLGLSKDPAKWSRLSTAASDRVRNRFTEAGYLDTMNEVYEKILNHHA